VAAVLAICNEFGVGVVPHGGNTGYCGGATPHEQGDEIVLALRRMNRLRALDAENFSITVEAGCLLAEVQAAAEAADRFFPLSLGSEGSCQIGGNLSTNAGGLNALRYGVARDLVLGLEVVLADGRVIDGLTSLRKDNTGYDLRDLFVGAEGTLGVITAASLKLFPRPRTVETAFVAVSNTAAAVQFLSRLRAATGDNVTSFELLPRIAIELDAPHPGVTDPLDRPFEWYGSAVSTAQRTARAPSESALQQAVTDGLALDAVLAESLAQRNALSTARSVPKHGGGRGQHQHDVSVPVAPCLRSWRKPRQRCSPSFRRAGW
jgi:D-lactate dehydrogenase (cytochrome)